MRCFVRSMLSLVLLVLPAGGACRGEVAHDTPPDAGDAAPAPSIHSNRDKPAHDIPQAALDSPPGQPSPLPGLVRVKDAKSKRASSWDQRGRNTDCITIGPRETALLANIEGAGMITSFYITTIDPDPLDYRDAVLRMYWDGEKTPSVEVPLGDFFCISNCIVRRFSSYMMAIQLGQGGNNGLTCYFPMPFSNGARIEVCNESNGYFGGRFGGLWYHINYEQYGAPLPDDVGRFHAQWRRENPTTPSVRPKSPHDNQGPFEANPDGKGNYVILEAEGKGHVAGLFLQVDNTFGGWWGEGDDMIFIDGDTWPPSMPGTGSEEIFGGGAGPDTEYAGLYSGFLLVENKRGIPTFGKNAMYRWYVQDPIRFAKSIRMTVEHGHANDKPNDYTSVVYWYQTEPHAPFPPLPRRRERHPDRPAAFYKAHDKLEELSTVLVPAFRDYVFEGVSMPHWRRSVQSNASRAQGYMESGQYEEAAKALDQALALIPASAKTPR